MLIEKHNSHVKMVIIGAGPSGLGAGWRLTELGYDNFRIYEATDHVGGLASSFLDNKGFTWDVGGHVLHSHYDYFDKMFKQVMGEDLLKHERESWIWIYDRFIPYFFQNNIRYLPKQVLRECLEGLKKLEGKAGRVKINNFADWVLASFGTGIAKHFMLPYNRKVWAYPLEKMNYSWVGDRVATIDAKRIRENIALGRDDVSWGPNSTFYFPKKGGTGEIWRRVAARFVKKISLNKKVVKIKAKAKKIFFADGSQDVYDYLLTTIPLDKMEMIVDDVSLPRGGDKLHYSTVYIVGLGIKGQVPDKLKSKCWIYFPENNAPFFRATVFSNYSSNNAPADHWSLMCEVAVSRFNPKPTGSMAQAVVRGAIKCQLLTHLDRVTSRWVYRADHGYPTPTIKRDDYINEILPVLELYNIYSRGRFGAWKYEVSNQDHTFMQGVEWVERILQGKPEVTLFAPEKVNRRE